MTQADEKQLGVMPDDESQVHNEASVEEVNAKQRTLDPLTAEKTFTNLKTRFTLSSLHEGINWSDVEASLKANPEALWSLAQMESAGHEPDVYHEDNDFYYFGTCSEESPKSAENCVYDKKAADSLRWFTLSRKFDGSAVEMAEAMGITLMLPEHYLNILQKKGEFDKKMESWLLTASDIRSTGRALSGYRDRGNARVYQTSAGDHTIYGAWRGSLKVKKTTNKL